MNNYFDKRESTKTRTTTPTQTDQAAARETDINVIVGRMLPSGKAPGHAGPPVYADWTNYPTDLRDLINQGRSMREHIARLPPQLRDLPLEQLIQLTNEQIAQILAPPAPKPEDKPTESKT